jgi:LPS O-antigen subunit length determinant protein (WzzB/FepE family)
MDDAKKRNADMILKLTEALNIAENLGLDDPIEYQLQSLAKINAKSNITTELSAGSISGGALYKEGSDALKARIEALKKRTELIPFISEIRTLEALLVKLKNNEKIASLKNRTNDDPFIPELRSLDAKLLFLDNCLTCSNNLSPLSLAIPATPPMKPDSPKKLLLLLGAILFAVLSGVGVVFIHHLSLTHRTREKNKS